MCGGGEGGIEVGADRAFRRSYSELIQCRMVVDYDDALFHQYDAHPNPWVRLLGAGPVGVACGKAVIAAGAAPTARLRQRGDLCRSAGRRE